MKKQKINGVEEQKLDSAVFAEHLKTYQQENASDIPVILFIAQAKETCAHENEVNERKINMPFYGNAQMDAFYFYKPISSIIQDD